MSARGFDVSRAARRRDAIRRRSQEREQQSSPPSPSRTPLILAAALLLLVAAGLGGLRFLQSGYFSIQHVTVRGASHVSAEEAIGTSGVTGQRYFSLDADQAVARLEALPWVKSASVTSTFPHNASISLTERVPIGIWRIGGVGYLVDDTGVVLDAANNDTQNAALPSVDASQAGDDLRVGDRVDPDPLRVALALSQQPPNSAPGSNVQLHYDKTDGLTATTSSGLVVYLGDGEALEYKLAVWRATVARVPATELHVLDLRFGDKPYYR